MYKVFINEQAFFFHNNYPSFDNFKKCKTSEDLNAQIQQNRHNVYFKSEKKLWKIIHKTFNYIEAGGGVVLNKKGEILFIFRRGKWDLPKGKIEKNESIEEGSIREVIEECGLKKNPNIIKELPSTFHTYEMKGKKYFKRTYWFLMKYDGDEILTPQTEEDIEKVIWAKKENLVEQFSNTYKSINEVLKNAGISS